MAVTLLNMTVAVEPDLQRLATMTLDATAALGGNTFEATSVLSTMLPRLRGAGIAAGRFLQVAILCDTQQLKISWDTSSVVLCSIGQIPPDFNFTALSERLTAACEAGSPTLLVQRYLEIRRQLEQARATAAQEVADLGVVLERKKRDLEEMLHKAETDGLTGLLNRRAYEERIAIAAGSDAPCSLVFFDLDHFKDINDRDGHAAGDVYLRRMADAVRRSMRGGADLAFRIGGDEFAVLVFAGEGVGERLATAVLTEMRHKLSIGIAERHPGEPVDAWSARADAALYAAKHAGRGCLRLASRSTDSAAAS
ncbi:MAG: GGDEF domain-containing protein [Acidiferrobacteraceae bacterium]